MRRSAKVIPTPLAHTAPAGTTTFDHVRLPAATRAINWIGATLERAGLDLIELSPGKLRAAARTQALADAAIEDPPGEALQVLLQALQQRWPRYHLSGRLGIRGTLVRLLSNRLQIRALLAQHPEIRALPVPRPLFIVGLPRTGTTLLHNLLAQDPQRRAPLLWEMWRPCPYPTGRPAEARLAEVRQAMEHMNRQAPQLRAIHTLSPTLPEECLLLLQNSLETMVLDTQWDIPSYRAWLLARDATDVYRDFRQQLQILQWRMPAREWVLKSPYHLFSLDALRAVFPDACIVHTHRDPRQVSGSLCSLTGVLRTLTLAEVDSHAIGQGCLDTWGTAVDRALAVRRRADEAQAGGRSTQIPKIPNSPKIHDVYYQDLRADPLATVLGIYQHFGLELTPEAAAAMEHWLQQHPQHAHGVHRYNLARFGLRDEAVTERFADYVKHFDIPPG